LEKDGGKLNMTTDQFDNFQLDPNLLGTDWVFSGKEVHMNRAPRGRISNPQYYFVEARRTNDYTRVTLGNPVHEAQYKIGGGVFEIHGGYVGHGVDWSLFNYNPYGGRYDSKNPNFRVKNDWLLITGLGGISVVTDDVMDKDEVEASGMVAYRNYPSEGYSSYGKKTGGASGDKRWAWKGNTWVPAA
jgi:hypothetical protein